MRKVKKKQNNNLIKGSLCILTGLLLSVFAYFDAKIDKNNISLMGYTENTVFTNVNNYELLRVLNKETGVVLIINNKEYMNKLVNILHSLNNGNKIYVYNIKNEELILGLNKNDEIVVKQEATEFYNILVNKLGAYSEKYTLTTKDGKIKETGKRKINTPMVLFVQNGKILYSHYISGKEKDDDELINIYKKGYIILNKDYSS